MTVRLLKLGYILWQQNHSCYINYHQKQYKFNNIHTPTCDSHRHTHFLPLLQTFKSYNRELLQKEEVTQIDIRDMTFELETFQLSESPVDVVHCKNCPLISQFFQLFVGWKSLGTYFFSQHNSMKSCANELEDQCGKSLCVGNVS